MVVQNKSSKAVPSDSESVSEDNVEVVVKEQKKPLSVQDMKGRSAIALYDYTGKSYWHLRLKF